jgi:hypothetical protein
MFGTRPDSFTVYEASLSQLSFGAVFDTLFLGDHFECFLVQESSCHYTLCLITF